MTTHATLLARIRGEYREMPGLRLTFSQACRLWDLDASTCQSVLDALLTEGFLHRRADGAYLAWPEARAIRMTSLTGSRWRDAAQSA